MRSIDSFWVAHSADLGKNTSSRKRASRTHRLAESACWMRSWLHRRADGGWRAMSSVSTRPPQIVHPPAHDWTLRGAGGKRPAAHEAEDEARAVCRRPDDPAQPQSSPAVRLHDWPMERPTEDGSLSVHHTQFRIWGAAEIPAHVLSSETQSSHSDAKAGKSLATLATPRWSTSAARMTM